MGWALWLFDVLLTVVIYCYYWYAGLTRIANNRYGFGIGWILLGQVYLLLMIMVVINGYYDMVQTSIIMPLSHLSTS